MVAQAVITYSAGSLLPDVYRMTDTYGFAPCFEVRENGNRLFTVWVRVTGFAADIAVNRLERKGLHPDDARETLHTALHLYGVRRLEPLARELLSTGSPPDADHDVWALDTDAVDLLLSLVDGKSCDYQKKMGRDLFCIASASLDKTAVYQIGGRKAAPTSRPLCNGCELPTADYLCSHLLHPQVATVAVTGPPVRSVRQALCDRGRTDVSAPQRCRAGGHECWQRVVEASEQASTPLSPLGLAESFDVLDAMWRLTYSKNRRLLARGPLVGPAALAINCSNRAEFESRLSSLADVISRIEVGDDLLPPNLSDGEKTGSINRLKAALLLKLPAEQHGSVENAVKVLRQVVDVRNAMQHSRVRVPGGLTGALRELGIHDAPPNWSAAWGTVRSKTADALTVIRGELLRWVDAQP